MTPDQRLAAPATALPTLRERLEQSERAAVNYAADQGIVALDQVRDSEGVTLGSRTLAAANLDALNSALNEAISDRVRAQAALTGSGANSPEAIGSATLASLRQQREVAAAEHRGIYQRVWHSAGSTIASIPPEDPPPPSAPPGAGREPV